MLRPQRLVRVDLSLWGLTAMSESSQLHFVQVLTVAGLTFQLSQLWMPQTSAVHPHWQAQRWVERHWSLRRMKSRSPQD